MDPITSQRVGESIVAARDRTPADPPIDAAAGTRTAEAWLRNVAATALVVLSAQSGGLAAIGLGAVALACASGRAPRATAALTAFFAATSGAAHGTPVAALLLAAIAILRMRLHLGGTGAWLRSVRALEWRRAHALVATGIARSRRSERGDAALIAAGDHYEREGAARAALAAIGAVPAPWVAPLADIAERAGRLVAGAPSVRDAAERFAAARS